MKKVLLFAALSLSLFSLCSCDSSKCTVKFYNEETLLLTVKVNKGETAVYSGRTPTKEGTVSTHYTFKGWDHNLKNVIESFDTHATFIEATNTYTVKFVNPDGTVLKTDTVAYGENATYDGTPNQDSTNDYYYTFTGWDKSLENITANTTITATYEQHAIDLTGMTFHYSSYNDGYLLDGFTSTSTLLYLPDTYDDGTNGVKKVIGITNMTLKNNKTITEVHLGKYSSTEGITFPFSSCTALAKFTIASDAPTFQIYEGALYTKGDNPTLICYPAYYEGSTPIFLEGVATIQSYAFYNNQYLTNVTFPSTVKSIKNNCFGNCAELVTVTVPDSVTSLNNNFTVQCKKLTTVTFGSGLTTLPYGTFISDSALTNITLPSGLVTIKSQAFEFCFAIQTVNIPSTVTTIETGAFYDCTGLLSFVLEGSNTNFKIVDDVLFNSDVTTLIAYPLGKNSTSYVLPSTVKRIGLYAFQGEKSLTSITFSNVLETIEGYAFAYLTSLTDIVFPASLRVIEGQAFNGVANSNSYIIPSGVTTIGAYAFSGNSNTILYMSMSAAPSTFETNWNYGVKGAYFFSDSDVSGTWHYVDGVPTLRA